MRTLNENLVLDSAKQKLMYYFSYVKDYTGW